MTMRWVLQFLLFLVTWAGFYSQIWDCSVFSGDVLWMIFSGLALGLCFFVLSFVATTPVSDLKPSVWLPGFWEIDWAVCGKAILRYGVLTALYEELLWRVGLQSMLCHMGGVFFGLFMTGLLFSAMHYHRFQGRFFRILEFLCFSLMLGFLFYWTHSFLLVVMVHFCRNSMIVVYRLGVMAREFPEN